MRLLLQRVSRASVEADGARVGEIGQGLLVLAGFGKNDGPDLPESRVWRTLCDKVLDLRVFPDVARALFERLSLDLSDLLARAGCGPFARGVFGAEMRLDFVNWGPVTILLDSADFS